MKMSLIWVMLLWISPAFAGDRPTLSAQGPEFQVNSRTAGDQSAVCMAMSSAGDFVITWDAAGQDGDRGGVFGKRYDRQGRELSVPPGIQGAGEANEFQVNSFTAGGQGNANVAMDQEGNFVVVWQSFGQDGSRTGIFAKRYDSQGRELPPPTASQGKGVGNEFQVNGEIRGSQGQPSVVMGSDGAFFAAWSGRVFPRNQGGLRAILAQRYDPSGARLGREFVVSRGPRVWAIAMAAGLDGSFLLSWAGEGEHVWLKRYDSRGQGIDPPWGLPARKGEGVLRVSSYTGTHGAGPYYNPHGAALGPEGAIVVFGSRRQDGEGNGLFAKRYDRKGNELHAHPDTRGAGVGNEFQVNTYT